MPTHLPQPPTLTEWNASLGDQLPAFLMAQRWFGGKARPIRSADVADAIPIPHSAPAFVLFVRVSYDDGGSEMYVLPILSSAAPGGEPGELRLRSNQDTVFTGALGHPAFLALLWRALARSESFPGPRSEIRADCTATLASAQRNPDDLPAPRLLKGEQSNTSVIFGDRFIFKLFRRAGQGINPDLEVGRFLTEKARFTHVAPVAASFDYRSPDGSETTLGILQGFVPNQGDAWRYALREVNRFYDATKGSPAAPAAANAAALPPALRECLEPFLASSALLGKRTAELHLALASDPSDPAFSPEPFTDSFARAFEHELRTLVRQVFDLLRGKLSDLPGDLRIPAAALRDREPEILARFHAVLSRSVAAARTRIHGDYHLGQVLWTGSDFVIIDFEGEPARPLAERRAKRSPLQDVAGMLRSFHYAAMSPLLDPASAHHAPRERENLMPWARLWNDSVSSRFLNEYLAASGPAIYLPQDAHNLRYILQLHLLQKAVYELGYELNNRPAWIGIPLSGIAALLENGDSRQM